MEFTPKLTDLRTADLTPAGERRLQAAAAAAGGCVLNPGTDALESTLHSILSTVEAVLEYLDAEALPPIVQDRVGRADGAA